MPAVHHIDIYITLNKIFLCYLDKNLQLEYELKRFKDLIEEENIVFGVNESLKAINNQLISDLSAKDLEIENLKKKIQEQAKQIVSTKNLY